MTERPDQTGSGAPRPGATDARETVLLLPGMLCDADLWVDAVTPLGDRVDLVFARLDGGDTIGAMAQALLRHRPPRFSVVGHSLGGIVALEIARQAPRRVLRLALLHTSALAPSASQLRAWSGLRQRVEQGQFERIATEQPGQLLPPHRADDPRLVARVARMARSVGRRAFLDQLQAQSTRVDLRPFLASMPHPALVVAGSDDLVCPKPRQVEIADGMPHARLEVLPGCGHLSPLEAPAAVRNLLDRWLGEPASRL